MAIDPRHTQKGNKELDAEAAKQERKDNEFFGFEVKGDKSAPDSSQLTSPEC